MQLQKMELGQAPRIEFDAVKDHLETYMSLSNPAPPRQSSRVPTRHISHLTQMAARALHRDVPAMAAQKGRKKGKGVGAEGMERAHVGWDEMKDYTAKEAWRGVVDARQADTMRGMEGMDLARLERRWTSSWDKSPLAR